MGSKQPLGSNDDGGSTNDTDDDPVVDIDEVIPPPISLVTLAANLQEGFNANHIGWNGIDWSLFAPPRPNEVDDYSVSRSLDSIKVFIPQSFVDPPEFLQEVDEFGELVFAPVLDEFGEETGEEVPVFELDQFGNPLRIVDSAADLFLAIGGSDSSDHLRNRDYTFNSDNFGGTRNITGAFMGFSGDDALYSENIFNPMLMGGSGDDSYILENKAVDGNAIFTQIVEYGGDDDDTVISYENDWAFALDIDGQHLVLINDSQSDTVVFWDYNVPDAKIENFWFDFDENGLNEHYSFDRFIDKLKEDGFWQGSFASEALGISRPTMQDLTQVIAEAVTLSNQIEDMREADQDTAISIARLYQASFDRAPDLAGLNFWIDQWELSHLNLSQIADSFYQSVEFVQTYGSLDDLGFATLLYSNVLDRAPDQDGLAYWLGRLDDGMARSDVLASFSESLENKVNTEIDLNGLAINASGDWVL